MKKMKLWMMAAILFCGASGMISCTGNGNANTNAEVEQADEDTVGFAEETGGYNVIPAVDQYLVDSIGVQYTKGDVCIPCATIVSSMPNKNPNIMKVLGDFWVFNFKVSGDTLKTVSGGDHPGMMCLHKGDDGIVKVISFEQVESGHGNEESAKRIFGDMYEAFHGINSDEDTREQARAMCIAKYVKDHNLPVKYYQDYGWPAKEIPTTDN